MDASITPLRHSGLSLVQTTDFFYPLVEDPYMQVSGMIHKWLLKDDCDSLNFLRARSPAPTCCLTYTPWG